jgi:hypothetical protein
MMWLLTLGNSASEGFCWYSLGAADCGFALQICDYPQVDARECRMRRESHDFDSGDTDARCRQVAEGGVLACCTLAECPGCMAAWLHRRNRYAKC